MSKITLLPDYISVVQTTSLDFYNKSTNLLNAIGDYLAEINENIKFSKGLVTTNVLSAYGVLFNELNTTDFTVENFKLQNDSIVPAGVKTLDNSFKLFFIEKYLSLSDQYKERVNVIASKTNYLAPFSDDIGYITTDITCIVDNNVSPYFDTFNSKLPLQSNIPATLTKRISKEELILCKTFSYYTDALLKINLQGLQSGTLNEFTAKLPHGSNLITDILYFRRAVINQQAFLTELQIVLGDVSSFIQFFKDLNPRDQNPQYKAIFSKYTITNLEELEIKVDLLKNNLNKISLSSKEVLSVN